MLQAIPPECEQMLTALVLDARGLDSRKMNVNGQILLEVFVELHLVAANIGTSCTFRGRGYLVEERSVR